MARSATRRLPRNRTAGSGCPAQARRASARAVHGCVGALTTAGVPVMVSAGGDSGPSAPRINSVSTADLDALARAVSNDQSAVVERVMQIARQAPAYDDGGEYRADTVSSRVIQLPRHPGRSPLKSPRPSASARPTHESGSALSGVAGNLLDSGCVLSSDDNGTSRCRCCISL